MKQDYLDVVDNNDHVIYRLARDEIHRRRLMHRAVHILVFNAQGNLFLQKRSMRKEIDKGLWDSSAAGHVDTGETYNASASRELWEELGINATLEILFKLTPTKELGLEFIQVFRCRHNGPFMLCCEEIDDGAWFSPENTTALVLADSCKLTSVFKTIWRHFLQIRGNDPQSDS